MARATDNAETRKSQAKNRLSEREGDKGTRWWIGAEETLHERVWHVAGKIHKNLESRRLRNFRHARTYADIDVDALLRGRPEDDGGRIAIGYNVTKSNIQTAASIIAKNRPQTMFLTDGGDYKTFSKAAKLTRYVAGVMSTAKIHPKTERVFTDGGSYGTGALHLWADEEKKRVSAEWVFLNEILVDEIEGLRETPSQIHRRKYVPRDSLLEQYPDHEEAILKTANDLKANDAGRTVGDVVPVIESWHMRSGPNASDGLHTICVEGATLFSEPYEKDYYPIIFWRWDHAPIGFWGIGISDELESIQRMINRTLSTIDEAQELVGVPVIWEPVTAQVSEDDLYTNELARRIRYFGDQRPQFDTPPSVAPELYQHLQWLIQSSYQVTGVPQATASGEKEPGLDSGIAQRERQDIVGGRFQVVGQRWEEFFVEIAEVIVDLSRDLAKATKDLSITAERDGKLTRINWKDVDLDKDRFRIQPFEVSALPQTPAGRLQTLSEWFQSGLISREVFMQLSRIPDIEQDRARQTATVDLVLATVTKIKDDDAYTNDDKPIPEMNLELASQLVTQETVVAKLQGIPDETIELLRAYNEDIKAEKARQDAAAAANAPPSPPQDQSQGAPPPPDQQQQPPPTAQAA
jgi:hypothetical protein